ncbi:hypothetical protein [Hahella sp. CR1]|uniref:hypothetical protein n=1 Tax=unclassified Hahella TaxID=2624107 RepID=UPI002441C756|nr:hypothetical protein [Hahella sp. CR1]MDG9667663.1 hypothetical protein [Hahella sp. CR1]
MTTLIVLLAIFITASIIVSGVMYSRQQALAYRQSQLKSLKQKYEEINSLFQVIMRVDDSANIAISLNHAMIEIAQSMTKMDRKSEELRILLDNLKQRERDLKTGVLLPQAQKTVTSDAAVAAIQRSLSECLQKLQRFKLRGSLPVPLYEEYSHHLREMALDVEVGSQLQMAESLVAQNDKAGAEKHFKHAREALKRTRLEIPNKNDQIKEISDKIKSLMRDGETQNRSQETQ